ncbi:hypothetical protein PR048_009501 [Dryococelus australis]|uniref:Endonuclease/exonuclease/phosphatase domain-containing protein n=1 Tax=Dryococelus australis TaxID=614101 RepID=A0ABQ9I019_9NEOP|nr:hypothetical protein PR048_009501 [Dryococelus australis]
MATWNAPGLLNKTSELHDFLRRHDLLPTDKIFLQGFSIQCQDRNLRPIAPREKHTSHRGLGVAIAIRTNIKHKVLPIPDLGKIEAIAASLTIKGKQCTIVAMYAPPGKIIEPWDLNKLIRLSTSILALGYKMRSTLHGTVLALPVTAEHYSDTKSTPPIWSVLPTTQHTIPKLQIKKVNFICELEVIHKMHSDHLPVIATIEDAETDTHPQKPNPNYSKAKWQRFNAALHNSLDLSHKINTTEELEESIITLTKTIHTTVKNTIPHRVKNIHFKDSLPKDVKNLITQRNHVRHLWQRNRLRWQRNRLRWQRNWLRQHKTEVNRLNKAIKEKLAANRAMLWDDKIAAFNLKDNSLSHTTKRLTRQTITIPPLREPHNRTTSSPQEKADLLAAMLELAFKPNINPSSPDQIATIERHARFLLSQPPPT